MAPATATAASTTFSAPLPSPPPDDGDADQPKANEPLLKYERVGGHFHAIFKDDSLSCIALHVNFVCVGTYNGNVLLLELDGRFIRRLHQHYKKVNHVCIDETGQFIASCSDDGTVAVYTLFPSSSSSASSAAGGNATTPKGKTAVGSSQQVSVASTGGEVNIYNYFSAIYTVQLEDRYAMKRERSFACGGVAGQLIINKKGWIIDKESTVHEGEGPVHAIKWCDGLVAWANDWGVKVYDADKDQRITYLERPPQCPPMELCRCHLEWQSRELLLVGWAHTLRVVALKTVKTPIKATATTAAATSADPLSPTGSAVLPPGTVTAEVVSLITFDFFVAGISPWSTTAVCVLAYRPPGSAPTVVHAPSPGAHGIKNKSEKRLVDGEGEAVEMPFPEVHVVGLDGKQVSADILNLRGYARLRASDYKMPSLQYMRASTAGAGAGVAVVGAEGHADGQAATNKSGADTANDASLDAIYEAGHGRLQYICTPKDVVICRLRDVDDRVAWALSRKQYEQALTVALQDPRALRKHALGELMELFIGELVKQKQFKRAAEEIKKLFIGDEFATLWEKYVYVFAQRGQLSAIAKVIPTTSPRLPRVQYEMVLKHFLDSDPGQLLEIIRKWPKPRQYDAVHTRPAASTATTATSPAAPTDASSAAPEYTETSFPFEPLYDAQAWINQLESVVRRRRTAETAAASASDSENKISIETSYVMEALAELYTATEQYEHALRIYLSQGAFCTNKDHAFKLITEHQLWPLVQNKVLNLMQIDRASAVRMLVNQTDQIKVFDVVKQLDHDRELLHEYLHDLFVHRLPDYNTEMYASLHETQVALYSEFAPSLLLNFLQTSKFVPLEKSFEYCSERSPPLWEAMIYILGRMGQHKRALDLLLTQMHDINQAIQFVQDNDANLWDYLIDLSLTSKENVEELLRCAAHHKIDPIKLIKKIPDDMEIDQLKAKMLEIISNYRIQQNLCEGCNKAFENDRVQLLQRQVLVRKRARRVAPKKQCSICREFIRPPGSGMDSVHVCVFECGHCYHLPCLQDKMRTWKRTEVVEEGRLTGLRGTLGCFVCDHSTRAYARNTRVSVTTDAPARGVTEEQLQRAKDVLTIQMAGA